MLLLYWSPFLGGVADLTVGSASASVGSCSRCVLISCSAPSRGDGRVFGV